MFTGQLVSECHQPWYLFHIIRLNPWRQGAAHHLGAGNRCAGSRNYPNSFMKSDRHLSINLPSNVTSANAQLKTKNLTLFDILWTFASHTHASAANNGGSWWPSPGRASMVAWVWGSSMMPSSCRQSANAESIFHKDFAYKWLTEWYMDYE